MRLQNLRSSLAWKKQTCTNQYIDCSSFAVPGLPLCSLSHGNGAGALHEGGWDTGPGATRHTVPSQEPLRLSNLRCRDSHTGVKGGVCEGCSFLRVFTFCRLLQHRKNPGIFSSFSTGVRTSMLPHWKIRVCVFGIDNKSQRPISHQRKQLPSPRCSTCLSAAVNLQGGRARSLTYRTLLSISPFFCSMQVTV